MSKLIVTTTREEWFKSIFSKSQSRNSVDAAHTAINRWDEYLKSINQIDADVLIQLKEMHNSTDLYRFLNKYMLYLSDKIAPLSCKLFFNFLKSWLRANGIRVYNDDIKQFVTYPKPQKELRQPLTPEIVRNLILSSPKQIKIILFVLLSSGMRISEVLQLKVMDINTLTDPIQIRIRAETTKTRSERIAYMSDEAWKHVKLLISDRQPTDSVFFKSFTEFALHSFELRFGFIRKQLGYMEKYSNGRNYHVNVHAFRAYFHTQATRILGGDIAHALLGHGEYLDQYFRLTQEEQSEMYHKLEPYLTISDEARQRVIIAEKDQQLSEMNDMKLQLEKVNAKVRRLEKLN